MSLKILDEDIKNSRLSGIYFLYGDESYDIQRYINKIKKCFNNLTLGVNYFEITKDNISDLASVCEGVTFFGEDKLVIIKETKLKFNIDILENISSDKLVVIIIEESVDKRTTDYKKISKMSVVVTFNKQTPKDAVFFIIKMLNAYKIKVTKEVAEYMLSVCTEDKQTLINEFRKITAYLKPSEQLTKEVIDKICVKTIDAKIFDIIDLLLKDDKQSAVKLYDDLIASKVYTGIIEAILFKHIKNIYYIKLMMQDENYKNIDIAKELKIHPFVYSKLISQINKYNIDKLENLIYEFDKYDFLSKTGKMDQTLGLKKLLLLI